VTKWTISYNDPPTETCNTFKSTTYLRLTRQFARALKPLQKLVHQTTTAITTTTITTTTTATTKYPVPRKK
jgi:hypothetical protein